MHGLLAERTRIAQELHDTLLQGFLAVSMQLRAAVDDLPADSATKRLNDLLPLIDRVLEEGRRTVQGLRSPSALLPPLEHALANVPTERGISSAIVYRVLVSGRPRRLRPGAWHEAFRIACEAIVNAYRHSNAKAVEVELEYRHSGLRLAVRDDGCGIDPHAMQWTGNGHLGLQGMRERAERIGGQLRLLSRVGLGTEVELLIPRRILTDDLA